MPDFNAIADVSQTLREFLQDGLRQEADLNDVVVLPHDLQSTPTSSPPNVSLFLFEVLEDPSARNRPRVREPDNGQVKIRKPDLTLLLRYLITPWSDQQATVQKILGRITQLFYDHAIISGTDLRGSSLSTSSDALKVTMAPLDTRGADSRVAFCRQVVPTLDHLRGTGRQHQTEGSHRTARLVAMSVTEHLAGKERRMPTASRRRVISGFQ